MRSAARDKLLRQIAAIRGINAAQYLHHRHALARIDRDLETPASPARVKQLLVRRQLHATCLIARGDKVREPRVAVKIGEITESLANAFAAMLARAPRADLHLRVESRGGQLKSAFAMFDAIRAHRGHTSAHTAKVCASAAVLLFVATGFRTCGPRAVFLAHQPELPTSAERRWTADKHRRIAGLLAANNGRMAALIAERTGRALPDVNADLATEDTMNVVAAYAAGLVHVPNVELPR